MIRALDLHGVPWICFSWYRIPSGLSLDVGACVVRRAANNYGFGD